MLNVNTIIWCASTNQPFKVIGSVSKKMQAKKTYTTTLRLSGEDLEQELSMAEFIMKRENWTFPVYVKNAMKEYNQRHGAGNNSFQLDKFGVTWTKAQSVNKCGFARHPKGISDLAVMTALYKPKNQVMGVCSFHKASVDEDVRSGGHIWVEVSGEKRKEN
jgi:hypothetical protein